MDTIVAISTAPGNSGIGIVRMSGKNSFEIINKIFNPINNTKINGYSIKYGHIIDNNDIIDEVLVSYFIGPKSYTGEDMCEINSHGNNIILKRILEICLKNGAKLADPGEFTKRAFFNGRIDLIQAESVIDLINSKSEIERKNAVKSLNGYLSKDINNIKAKIFNILSNIEASIDYPEYDIEEITSDETKKMSYDILNDLKIISNTFENGKLIKDGISVAIVGKPNAGKSSLLNKILREDRAIVTNIEGTTRDTIEESVNIDGILFKLIDTAGIRKADNEIEKIGINKSKAAINEADLIIAIFDITKELSKDDFEILESIKNKKKIILLNKIDLNDKKIDINLIKKYGEAPIIEISIKNDNEIDVLYKKMIEIFNIDKITTENTSIITNLRQKESINKAEIAINNAIKTINDKMPVDITAIYFKEAIQEINKITGEDVTEDIINDIFSKFCLGK